MLLDSSDLTGTGYHSAMCHPMCHDGFMLVTDIVMTALVLFTLLQTYFLVVLASNLLLPKDANLGSLQ